MTLVPSTPPKIAAGLLILGACLLLRCDVALWRHSSFTVFENHHRADLGTVDTGIFTPVMAVIHYICSLLLALLFSREAKAVGTETSLPSYPLAVKSPYLSVWLPGSAAGNAATAQPEFWTGEDLTWPVLARIDGKTWALFGDSVGSISNAATTDSVTFTSTHTYFQVTAGSVKFTLDFFTPVTPGKDEYAQQSLPYSYLTVTASSSGFAPASIQILSGIDQTWTAQEGRAGVNYTTTNSTGLFWYFNPSAAYYTESGDRATYGSVVFAASTGDGVTHTSGSQSAVFDDFSQDGALSESGSLQGNDFVAISQDLGQVGGGKRAEVATASATFVVGFQRDYAVNYLGKGQTGYHRSEWPTIPEAVDHVLENYGSALEQSKSFDTLIRSKAEATSSNYANIVEASVRQTFATFEITIPYDDLTATPSIFLKEISSNGNLQTIDLFFQTYPVFVSLNPEYIRLFFQPFLQYLNAGRWPRPWVIHDLGTRYPNATGHDNGEAEQMPLFETSVLFILLLAYEQLTGDTAYARQYGPLLRGYAEWLYNDNSLYPSSQLISVDSVAGQPNQTGLAIQSAIGLKAASALLGDSKYADLASTNVKEIYDNALGLDGDTLESSSHFTYYYGKPASWNVLFPAWSDVFLNLTTLPQEAYDLQSSWYGQSISEQGLAWSDSTDWGLLDWNIVVAAVSSDEVQKSIVETSHTFLTNGKTDVPFGTRYFVKGPRAGEWLSNKARPTVGSNFAILALKEGVIYGS